MRWYSQRHRGLLACCVLLPLFSFPLVSHAEETDPPLTDEFRIKPRKGTQAVKPAKPDWCKGYKKEDVPTRWSDSYFYSAYLRDDVFKEHKINELTFDTFRKVAWSACLEPDNTKRHEWTANFLQALVNLEGLTPDEARLSMKLYMLTEDDSEQQGKEACDRYRLNRAKTPQETALFGAWRSILRCDSNNLQVDELMEAMEWEAMKPEFSSEFVKAEYVTNCLIATSQRYLEEESYSMNTNKLGAYAKCGIDARSFDRKKAMAEVNKMENLSVVEKVRAVQTVAFTSMFSAWLTDRYKEKAKDDDAYQTILFDGPEAGFADWVKDYEAHRKAVDLAHAYHFKFFSNRQSKKKLKEALTGCIAPLREGFFGYLKAKKVKTIADVQKAATQGIGYTLLTALAGCEAVDGEPVSASVRQKALLESAIPVGGPRDAAILRAGYELAELLADREDIPHSTGTFTYMKGGTNWAGDALTRVMGQAYGVRLDGGTWTDPRDRENPTETMDGEIKAIKKVKGGMQIEFKTVKWKEPVYDCKDTKKVDRIVYENNAARVIYQQNCKKAGTETRSSTIPSYLVSADVAKGLKKGMFIRSAIGEHDGALWGLPLEGYKNDKKQALIYVLGGSL